MIVYHHPPRLMPRRVFEWVVYLARDLLAVVGGYHLIAAAGHPGIGGGLAFLAVLVVVGARLPFEYSPGNAGSLGPHDG